MARRRKARAGVSEAFELVDEAATAALARQLAGFVAAGRLHRAFRRPRGRQDALARAFLRALLDDPELEAPSPTFTLMQVYDGPRFPVVHADFYRLRGADELAQIGWDEVIDGAVTLVEWPERAASALPADRLEIALTFRSRPRRRVPPRRGARVRRARAALAAHAGDRAVAARGRLGGSRARAARRRRVDPRLRAARGPTAARAILMISPPRLDGPILRYGKPYAAIAKLSPDIRAFLAIAEGLRAEGYSTPRDLRPRRRRRPGADRGFRRRDDRRRARARSRALRRGDGAARRSPRAATCRARCRSTASLRAADLRYRGDAGRGRAGARLVRAGGGARHAGFRRAHAVPRPVARSSDADPRPADDLDAARLPFAQPALAARAAKACAGSA